MPVTNHLDVDAVAAELPEPKEGCDGELLWHNEDIWLENDSSEIYTEFSILDYGRLSPEEAREVGLALIAAAHQAERNRND